MSRYVTLRSPSFPSGADAVLLQHLNLQDSQAELWAETSPCPGRPKTLTLAFSVVSTVCQTRLLMMGQTCPALTQEMAVQCQAALSVSKSASRTEPWKCHVPASTSDGSACGAP